MGTSVIRITLALVVVLAVIMLVLQMDVVVYEKRAADDLSCDGFHLVHYEHHARFDPSGGGWSDAGWLYDGGGFLSRKQIETGIPAASQIKSEYLVAVEGPERAHPIYLSLSPKSFSEYQFRKTVDCVQKNKRAASVAYYDLPKAQGALVSKEVFVCPDGRRVVVRMQTGLGGVVVMQPPPTALQGSANLKERNIGSINGLGKFVLPNDAESELPILNECRNETGQNAFEYYPGSTGPVLIK